MLVRCGYKRWWVGEGSSEVKQGGGKQRSQIIILEMATRVHKVVAIRICDYHQRQLLTDIHAIHIPIACSEFLKTHLDPPKLVNLYLCLIIRMGDLLQVIGIMSNLFLTTSLHVHPGKPPAFVALTCNSTSSLYSQWYFLWTLLSEA